MARITVEDCLEVESNRFSLVRLASKRAKQLLAGKTAVIDTRDNKAVVSALREIAEGKVRFRKFDRDNQHEEESTITGQSNGRADDQSDSVIGSAA